MKIKLIQTKQYLILIDEQAEINCKEMIFFQADAKSLIAETLNREKCKKIIAYYPLTKEAKELDLPVLPNPFEELVDIEKLAYEKYPVSPQKRKLFVQGYKATQSKQFSLEDMKKAIEIAQTPIESGIGNYLPNINEVLESLSTRQLPKEFVISDEFSTFEENIKNGEYKW